MNSISKLALAVLLAAPFVPGCGGEDESSSSSSPSSSSSSGGGGGGASSVAKNPANDAIRDEVADGRPSVEVVDIQITDWKEDRDLPDTKSGKFTAKLRLTEPHGYVLVEINKTNILKKVADKGHELTFKGTVHVGKDADGVTRAMAAINTNDNGWKALVDEVGPLTMGYNVIGDDYRANAFRKTYGVGVGNLFLAFSEFKPYAEDGTPEAGVIFEAENERQKQAQAAADERRRQQQEKAAAEQAQREAAIREQKLARLRPFLVPFKNPSGLALITNYIPDLAAIITESTVDDEKLTATGKGFDLSQLPFREFTFDAAVSETDYNLKLTISIAKDPYVFGSAKPTYLSGAANAQSLSILSPEDRARLDATIALEAKTRSETPAGLKIETYDAKQIAPQLASLKTTPLVGMPVYRGGANSKLQPLFEGVLTGNKVYNLSNNEVLSYRLSAPMPITSLFIKGGNYPTAPLVVTFNNLHTITIDSIAKDGGLIIHLPQGFSLFDIKMESKGKVGLRSVALVP